MYVYYKCLHVLLKSNQHSHTTARLNYPYTHKRIDYLHNREIQLH